MKRREIDGYRKRDNDREREERDSTRVRTTKKE
jgi:hypothetical protein